MGDQVTIALVGGALAILGVIVGQLISFITEGRKRKWQLIDQDKERVRTVRRLRLNQVEKFVERTSAEFNQARTDIILGTTHKLTQKNVDMMMEHYFDRAFGFRLQDNSKYTYTPIVKSIGDKGLLESWEKLNATAGELYKIQPSFYERLKKGKIPIDEEESNKLMTFGNANHYEYNDCIIDIYQQIDRVKSL